MSQSNYLSRLQNIYAARGRVPPVKQQEPYLVTYTVPGTLAGNSDDPRLYTYATVVNAVDQYDARDQTVQWLMDKYGITGEDVNDFLEISEEESPERGAPPDWNNVFYALTFGHRAIALRELEGKWDWIAITDCTY